MGWEVVYYNHKEQTNRPKAGKEIDMNKTYSAIHDYLSSVVDSIPCTINAPEERYKMLMNQENKYSYLFMLCNDMGIIEEQ